MGFIAKISASKEIKPNKDGTWMNQRGKAVIESADEGETLNPGREIDVAVSAKAGVPFNPIVLGQRVHVTEYKILPDQGYGESYALKKWGPAPGAPTRAEVAAGRPGVAPSAPQEPRKPAGMSEDDFCGHWRLYAREAYAFWLSLVPNASADALLEATKAVTISYAIALEKNRQVAFGENPAGLTPGGMEENDGIPF
jgi:hypothetical protein